MTKIVTDRDLPSHRGAASAPGFEHIDRDPSGPTRALPTNMTDLDAHTAGRHAYRRAHAYGITIPPAELDGEWRAGWLAAAEDDRLDIVRATCTAYVPVTLAF